MRRKTVTWALTDAEHKFWLIQARKAHLTVAEFIYTMAADHVIEHDLPQHVRGDYIALGNSLLSIGAAKARRCGSLEGQAIINHAGCQGPAGHRDQAG